LPKLSFGRGSVKDMSLTGKQGSHDTHPSDRVRVGSPPRNPIDASTSAADESREHVAGSDSGTSSPTPGAMSAHAGLLLAAWHAAVFAVPT